MAANPSRLRRSRRAALVVLGLVCGLGIGELLVRLLDLGPRFSPLPHENYRICDDPVLRYELAPGSTYLGATINADGMRDRERPIVKPPESFRIACIGDSIPFGLYVRQEEAFPARLESLLNERSSPSGTRFEVLNFGVTGYNITQSAANLRLRAMKYDPDLILFSYCLNDPSDYSAEFAQLRNRIGRVKRLYLDEVFHQPKSWAGHLRLYRLAYYAWLAKTDSWGWTGTRIRAGAKRMPLGQDAEEVFNDLHHPGMGWERVVDGFESLAKTAGSRGIPVYVVLFPVLDRLTDYPFATVHARVKAAAEQHGFVVIDLQTPLQAAAANSDEPIAVDTLHPTALGHAVVADALMKALLDAGFLPR